ncbi:substrate-binding domain-containing protein [Adhaeretor mobilis]|uniref:PBP superfamily domain protein n=1 Tax=Adhaeretor mobilis TaxID=1930276 RepID=A0A517MPN4_9BACT|nr:substrate-binding domain-containing protein [Adhaeretor mobilis]QDS96845.1 PBP superfamily domain protein [Adhaeretor mobilis]
MRLITLSLFVALGLLSVGCQAEHAPSALRLATTTSTRDSGLLEELLTTFEKQHQVRVDVVAAGTGKALKLGEAGDVDVLLVHAPEAEEAFMAAGHGTRREAVMSNTFLIIGPADDPANIRDLPPEEALQRIASQQARFLSRGDDSGTHQRELQLWKAADGRPDWSDYIETGQGMGATLTIADEMQGYTLTDRGTFLKFSRLGRLSKIELVPLVSGTVKELPEFANPYSVIVVDPQKNEARGSKLANAFADFLISDIAQQVIREFKIEGEILFTPNNLLNVGRNE